MNSLLKRRESNAKFAELNKITVPEKVQVQAEPKEPSSIEEESEEGYNEQELIGAQRRRLTKYQDIHKKMKEDMQNIKDESSKKTKENERLQKIIEDLKKKISKLESQKEGEHNDLISLKN